MTAELNIDEVVREAFFPLWRRGVLVEVGAARPDYLSISASFRKLGWKIIAIEPNPDFCAAHRALGYDVLEYACSDQDADDVEFFVVDSHGQHYMDGSVSFESFSSLGIRDSFASLLDTVKEKASVRPIRVKVRKLDTILAAHEPDLKRIDLLAIDVEGWELSVLKGLSLERYRPRVMIVENLFRDKRYRDMICGYGYQLWRELAPNEIYVRNELLGPIGRFKFGAQRLLARALLRPSLG